MPFRSCHPSFSLSAVLCLLLVLPVPAAAGAAQKRGSESGAAGEPESEPEFTIKVPVNVVPVNVTVTDKSGRPVKDLTAADFKLFEDGQRQPIQNFEIESGQPPASPQPVDPAGAVSAETGALKPSGNTRKPRPLSTGCWPVWPCIFDTWGISRPASHWCCCPKGLSWEEGRVGDWTR